MHANWIRVNAIVPIYRIDWITTNWAVIVLEMSFWYVVKLFRWQMCRLLSYHTDMETLETKTIQMYIQFDDEPSDFMKVQSDLAISL